MSNGTTHRNNGEILWIRDGEREAVRNEKRILLPGDRYLIGCSVIAIPRKYRAFDASNFALLQATRNRRRTTKEIKCSEKVQCRETIRGRRTSAERSWAGLRVHEPRVLRHGARSSVAVVVEQLLKQHFRRERQRVPLATTKITADLSLVHVALRHQNQVEGRVKVHHLRVAVKCEQSWQIRLFCCIQHQRIGSWLSPVHTFVLRFGRSMEWLMRRPLYGLSAVASMQ